MCHPCPSGNTADFVPITAGLLQYSCHPHYHADLYLGYSFIKNEVLIRSLGCASSSLAGYNSTLCLRKNVTLLIFVIT